MTYSIARSLHLRDRVALADLQPGLGDVGELQLRLPRPNGVAEEDVALDPDAGDFVEAGVAGAAGVDVADQIDEEEQAAGQDVEAERQHRRQDAADGRAGPSRTPSGPGTFSTRSDASWTVSRIMAGE